MDLRSRAENDYLCFVSVYLWPTLRRSRRLKFQHRLRARTNVQLIIDMPEMPADGAFGKTEAACDLFVGMSFCQQFENFHLTRRKFLHLGRGGRWRLERCDDFAS